MKKLLLKGLSVGCALFFGSTLIAQVNSFPYTENFETFNTCTGTCNSPCALPVSGNPLNDWTNETTTDNAEWTTDVGGTSSSLTGPSVDYNTGTALGKYLYIESSSPCYGTSALLYSPTFDLAAVGGMNMIFVYHMYGQSQGTMSIDASSDGGLSWTTNLWTMSGDQGDMWYQDTVSLTSYAGGNVIIRFRGDVGTDFYSDMAIDAITFYEPLPDDAGVTAIPSPGFPSCNLTNSNVTATIRNFGFNTLTSFDANWMINGLAQTPVSWTGTLAPNADTTISIGVYSFVDGDVLDVWTSNPNMVAETGSGPMNDTTSLIIQSGLSGTYSIGATGDYLTFTDAVMALTTYGVCSSVVFDIEDGTYSEQISIGEIMGADAANTITFQSANADPSLVTFTFASTSTADNFVLELNGADYLIIKDITFMNSGTTYATVLSVTNNSGYNTFDGNDFTGNIATSTTSTNNAVIYAASGSVNEMNTFVDNRIRYGSYGMYWYGESSSANSTGLTLDGNLFSGSYYRGIHLYYTDSTTIKNNRFTTSNVYTGSSYVAYFYQMDGKCEITNNQFYQSANGYACYLSSATAAPGDKSLMSNNRFIVEDLVSTSTSYGLYSTSNSNWNIVNNSFNIISQGTSSRAAYFSGGGGNSFHSNNISNDGPGFGIYLLSGLTNSDYNNIYAPNGSVGYFSANVTTLADWQTATAFDMNSVSGDPLYVASSDLHTCNDVLLDGAGMPSSLVLTDMDGQMRDTLRIDIGSDEFLGLINFEFAEDTIWKCSNGSVVLGGFEPVTDATYVWSTSEATPTIIAQNPGNYSVTATTSCGSALASVEIIDIPNALADFTSTSSYVTGIFTNTSTGTIDTYSWDFGDGSSSTAENPIHVYTSPGYFFVSLTVTGPCGMETYSDSILLELVGIDENQLENALEIYPNPNNGTFTLNISLEGISTVAATLIDARGVILWNADIQNVNGSASEIINVDVAPGIYFMKVSVDDKTILRKVLVE